MRCSHFRCSRFFVRFFSTIRVLFLFMCFRAFALLEFLHFRYSCSFAFFRVFRLQLSASA